MPRSDTLVFLMGEYRAEFPTDRHYATNHMWALSTGPQRYRFGLTRYAVRLLQDVYFLDWTVEPPTLLGHRQQIGSIESKKAESDLYAPLAGRLVAINAESLDDPSAINVDPYGEGWLIEIESEAAGLLSPQAYLEHLESAWKVAERTIKGQIQ
ncbi:glycine cleavage system protein H [Candidatus Laterigemmans baculatus]|uniref:glycine cleavage system protein H n=1 Tax=Candidatus Laterigemmans baculatus TaxID=2770505 RepID=UPI0013DD365E|nr:glycine cleavage system protein H [Candidatus Laterigemmans baculatus]